ncbi:MAG: putative F420-dependent oxidoreductase [Gammaproteobacteria bacterium]|jgi:probable F420-dependent oxidoreductase
MRIGVSFPTTEIGNNPNDIRTFAREVEAMGYDYLTCIDHVIQGREPVADDWRAYYVRANPFHETLVLFGFLAAVTETIGLTSAILILPQRPTVLVAKQLAEIDVLSGGRLRAGVGIGWNELEFEILGQSFKNRAPRMEEQIDVMRRLWTQELVTYSGEWHEIDDAGINPLPVQQPIPIWIGAFVTPAIRRAGRLADGLLLNPRVKPGTDEATSAIENFRDAAQEAGRDAASLGLEATVFTEGRGANAIREEVEAWRERGATYLTVRTMTAGLGGVDAHLKALEAAREAVTN